MTNMEYYREQIEKILGANSRLAAGVINKELCNCNSLNCCDCLFEARKGTCENNKLRWLMAEHKEEPMLTQRDYHLVQFLPDGWVSRDKVGMLNWYANKPIQNDVFWVAVNDISMKHGLIIGFGNSILPFIHWDDAEPWSVEDLRKLKVRENND